MPRQLRAERKRQGLTIRSLAKQIQISPSALSQIENARARPSVSTLYALITALSISFDQLFNDDANQGNATKSGAPRLGIRASDRPQAGANASPAIRASKPPAADLSPILHANDRGSIELETGVLWQRLTAHPDPDIDFLEVTYPVGSSSCLGDGLMRHAGKEYGVVVQGELELKIQFASYDLGPSDSVTFDSTLPHSLTNVGSIPVVAIWFIVGRRGD